MTERDWKQDFVLEKKKREAFEFVDRKMYSDASSAISSAFYFVEQGHPEVAEEHALAFEQVGVYMMEHDGPFSLRPGEHQTGWDGYYERYKFAEGVFEHAKQLNEMVHGKRSTQVMLDNVRIAQCLYWRSEVEGVDLMERAVRHEAKLLGEDSRTYAEHLVILGEMKVLSDWHVETGIEQLQQAIALLETMGDEGKPYLARAYGVLGKGDGGLASKVFEQGVRVGAEKEADAEHPGVGDLGAIEGACLKQLEILNGLGKGETFEAYDGWLQLAEVRMRRCELPGAEEAAILATRMEEKAPGIRASQGGRATRFLVDLAVYRGMYPRAVELQRQQIEAFIAHHGKKSPQVGSEWMRLCDILVEWQHLEEAKEAWKNAVRCKRPEGEGDCIDIMRSSKEAKLQRARGELQVVKYPLKTAKRIIDGKSLCTKPDKYKPYYQQELLEAACAREEEEKVLSTWGSGVDYNRVLRRTVLAADRVKFTPFFEEVVMRLSVATAERKFFWDHLEAVKARTDLALLMIKKGELEPAEKVLVNNYQTLKRTFGEVHPELARVLRAQARLLLARNQASAAEGLARKAFSTDFAVYGDGHLSLSEDLALLAEAQGMMRAFPKAIASIDSAIQLHSRKPRTETPATSRLFMTKADLMSRMGDGKGAAEALDRARFFYRLKLGKDHPRTLALKEQVDRTR